MNKHIEDAMEIRNEQPMVCNCAQTILRVYAKIGEFRRRIAENHDGMTDCKLLLKANAERGGNKKEHCDGMIREAITLIDELVSVSENKK